jgi:anti-sigma-K factor RskA
MDDIELHDLTAAYALDALDQRDVEAYEQHLATCARCRDELASFASTTAALAYAVSPRQPPSDLRDRILAVARAERANVVPLQPRAARYRLRVAAGIAAIAACAAVGFAAWNVALQHRLDRANEALRSVPLAGATGSVIVGANGNGSLVLANLPAAPAGETYEAWVLAGRAASPAGLFHGGSKTTVVRLSHRVQEGESVAVTVEPAGGSPQPTHKPFITSASV